MLRSKGQGQRSREVKVKDQGQNSSSVLMYLRKGRWARANVKLLYWKFPYPCAMNLLD